MGSISRNTWAMPETKVEVTRGEFDPREYKSLDKQNWAKKRRAEWMATTGKIQYVRERMVPSEEREFPVEPEKTITAPEQVLLDIQIGEEQKPIEEPLSMKSELIQKPKVDHEGKPKTEFWPRKKRSDITTERYI